MPEDKTPASTLVATADSHAAEPEITVEEMPEVDSPDAPKTLAGSYRVIHGSMTRGQQDVAACGSIVTLSHEDATAALAAKTVERA